MNVTKVEVFLYKKYIFFPEFKNSKSKEYSKQLKFYFNDYYMNLFSLEIVIKL
jgi:hypothetical protein